MKKIYTTLLLLLICYISYSQFKLSTYLPQSTNITKTIDYKYFIVGLDIPDSVTIYSVYLLTKNQCELVKADNLKKDNDPTKVIRKNNFKNESSINYIHVSDYESSGYDKGHLTESESLLFDKNAQILCFMITNMTPQYHAFNAGIWKSLESYGRLQAEVRDSTLITSGIILSSKYFVKTKNGSLYASKYNFKVLYFIKTKTYEAYVLENNIKAATQSFTKYKIDIRELEKQSGLKFNYIK
jgi:DNA/RNA endonuclease G (NUC1)